MELAVRKESDGSLERKTLRVKNGQDLAVITRQRGYEGWRINETQLSSPQSVELSHARLAAGRGDHRWLATTRSTAR